MASAIFSLLSAGRDGGRHQRLVDTVRAAVGAVDQPALLLLLEIVAAAEPAFELVVVVAGEAETDQDAALSRSSRTAGATVVTANSRAFFRFGIFCTRFVDGGSIDFGIDDARLVAGELGHHPAPGIDDQRMAESLAAVLVQPALRGGDHPGAVLDRAGPQQRMPVRLAGRRVKAAGTVSTSAPASASARNSCGKRRS